MVIKWPEYELEKLTLVNLSLNADPDSFLLSSNDLICLLGLSIVIKDWDSYSLILGIYKVSVCI